MSGTTPALTLSRLAAAMLLAACTTGTAAQDQPFLSRGELLLYENWTDTWSRSPFNRVTQIPDHSLNLELRPDVEYRTGQFATGLRPRLSASALPGEQDKRHSEAWLNEGWLRWRPASGASLQAGREVLLWGPSAFWNPSNPFFSGNNKDNPKREIAGHDFIRGRWQLDDGLSASLISQLGLGHKPDSRMTRAKRRDALKLDWTGSEASAAAIVSAEPDKSAAWQGWAQWTASDALILYGEAAWQRADSHLQMQTSNGPTGWQRTNSPRPYGLNAVLGAAYTFEFNWTLNAELWRNAAGLTQDESHALADSMNALSMQTEAMGKDVAEGQLASLIQVADPLRKHYLGMQLVNGSDAGTGWTLRYKRNLDDDSGEAFVMIKRDLGDTLQVWANLMLRHGNRDSEYGRWVRSSAMLGVSWFLW